MEWIITALASCLVFGAYMAVFALKVSREGPSAELHTCGQSGGCRCHEKLEKIMEGETGCLRKQNET